MVKKTKKKKTKIGKMADKAMRQVEKVSKQKVKSKNIMSRKKMSVHIPEYKAPSVLGDPNRFFKNELEQERRNMFL